MSLTLKSVLVVAGLILAIVGIVMENWKVATIGNSIALFGTLLV